VDRVRILVVEDERELAENLRRGLVAEGYHVDVAHDGHVGLALARTAAYAAIVLDLMIPAVNGFLVCQRLRADGVTTPILVLTAKDGVYDHTEALDSGADDYLTKPFSYLVLLAHLRALLRRRPGVVEATLVVGDLVLDPRRHDCHRGGQRVELTPREFALLETLAERPGEPVTKDELLLSAWPDEAQDVNLVEVRISSLRRKIDAPFGRQSVQTVRGIGYRLVDDRGVAP
jgi:DNA-binding response OmpR family regulator